MNHDPHTPNPRRRQHVQARPWVGAALIGAVTLFFVLVQIGLVLAASH